MTTWDLAGVPDGAVANKIDVTTVSDQGRQALRLSLDAQSRGGKSGVDFVDQPTFLLLPETFGDGAIEVEICGRLRADAPDFSRGFIGLAYRVADDLASYESVYLRPANGRPHAPGSPRDTRAVQYYAYPEWPFDRLREEELDRYEAGADIALDRWHRLRLEIEGAAFAAFVDGVQVLSGTGKRTSGKGRIGLWVDIGTDGFFANLSIASR